MPWPDDKEGDMSGDTRKLLQDACDRAARYIEELPARRVAPAKEAIEELARFDVPLGAHGTDAAQVIRELDEIGSPATMAMAGPRFFGFVIGGALPATVAANWIARFLGRDGLADMIERCCRHARRFAEGFARAGYEVLNDVVLNQVVVTFGPADLTNRVIDAIQDDGTCWCGTTTWRGRPAMRMSVSSWATTDADVEASLDAMLRVASLLRAEGQARIS